MQEDFKEKVREEVLDNINEELKELLDKKEPSKKDKEQIEFLRNLKETKKNPEEILRECYYDILDILDYYMELGEKEKKLIAIWTIGCSLHEHFNCYPYLYFNAMRGSGKTRLMKIITFLNNGILTTAPTEAVLFRSKDPLALDEFERMDSKEKQLLKEMLNTAYKKGLFVLRNVKRKFLGQEQYIIERFETYRPVCMANIWGMDDVLGDRCIFSILEKSENPEKTKKIEDFEFDDLMKKVRSNLIQCSLCSVVMSGGIRNSTKKWNFYINDKYKTTPTTHITHNTQTTHTTQQHNIILDEFFTKIDGSGLNGRSLELFFPIFVLANILHKDILKEIIEFSKKVNEERRSTDAENKDALLYKFVSEKEQGLIWNGMRSLINEFRGFLGDECEEWINPRWLGRALKRLNLVTSKRRLGAGVEVILNVVKAKEKAKIFDIK